jgi:hypothetical protein
LASIHKKLDKSDNIEGGHSRCSRLPNSQSSRPWEAGGLSRGRYGDGFARRHNGALAKGESYIPGKQGSRIYFSAVSIEDTLHKVELIGSRVLYPKTTIGESGSVAEFEDSEGNCIALHSA